MKALPLALGILLGTSSLFAQEESRAYRYLDINQVKARINNSSDHFWDQIQFGQYEVPKGSGKHVNFAGSLWIGGMDGTGNLRLAAQTYRQFGLDFYSGPYRTTHQYDTGRGFVSAAVPEIDGVLQVDYGKQMVLHDNGFAVYAPASATTVQQSISPSRTRLKGVYLPNGKTLLFGDNTYPVIQDAYLVDAANGYQPQSPMSLHFYHRHSAAVLMNNGFVLIAGIAGTELYNPATHSSTPTQSMPTPVMAAGAVLLQDGRVFLAGGCPVFSNYNSTRSETQLFDPATQSWTQGPLLPNGLVSPLTLLQSNGKVLIMGGSITQAGIYEYDPVSNTISTIGQLPEPFQLVRGGLLPSGDVIYVGTQTIGIPGGKGYRLNPATGISEEIGIQLGGSQAYTAPNGTVVFEVSPARFLEFDPVDQQLINMPYQKVWELTSSQIAQFRQDFQNNSVNFTQYPDIQSWPGNGITSKGEDAQLAPYVDVNNDGRYRPATDGDYPCILGDKALWWVFHDDGPHTETGGLGIGLQVEGMAYAFDCNLRPCPDTNIAYATFYHYEITHKSQDTLNQTYIGFWNDVDLGDWTDDYIGCDTLRNLGYAYNGDANDDGPGGYGANPPAFGVQFLGGLKMDKFISYDNDFSGSGNPTTAMHFYNYLSGHWADSTSLLDNGLDGHYLTGPGNPTDYLYPGNPGACTGISTGWTEGSANNMPYDRFLIQSSGPMTFAPQATVNLDLAFLYARGYYDDQLGSVCDLLNSADSISNWWTNLDKSCFSLVMEVQAKTVAGALQVYPNPAKTEVVFQFPAGTAAQRVEIFDPSGRKLREACVPFGQQSFSMQVADLPDGVYLVQCLAGDTRLSSKFVVAR